MDTKNIDKEWKRKYRKQKLKEEELTKGVHDRKKEKCYNEWKKEETDEWKIFFSDTKNLNESVRISNVKYFRSSPAPPETWE